MPINNMSNEISNPATIQALSHIGGISYLIPLITSQEDGRRLKDAISKLLEKVSRQNGFDYISPHQQKRLTEQPKTVKLK